MTLVPPSDLDFALAPLPSARTPEWRTILVATDGLPDSDVAVLLAQTVAARSGAMLHAIAVCDRQTMVYDRSAPEFDVLTGSVAADERAAVVTGQLARLLLADACPLVVRYGGVAEEVRRQASDLRADLIVAGRGRHGLLARLRGEGHVLQVIRAAPCSVLAVEGAAVLPRRVVVGIDFSPHGADVARTAVRLAADEATIYLMHVKPDPPFGIPHPGRWLESYEEGVRAGLERLRQQLALPPSRAVEIIVVHGHPGDALVAFARSAQADLIAVGRHGAGFLDRMLIGSVTARLVHSGSCSLLVVPAAFSDVRA
ncbi:MAG: universal stress protein [Gemmatimonadaceae bacterium]